MKWPFRFAAVLILFACGIDSSQAGGLDFSSFEVPGGYNTQGRGINNLDIVVGSYKSASEDPSLGKTYGFIYDANGFTKLGDGDGTGIYEVAGINDLGVSVVNALTGAYIRSTSGSLAKISIDGSVSVTVMDINNDGSVVGYYQDLQGYNRGFVMSSNGSVKTLDAVEPHLAGNGTLATGINNLGEIVGYYFDNNIAKGFTLTPDGIYAGVTVEDGYGTTFSGVNDLGQIVGYSGDAKLGLFTYVLEPDLTTFTPIIYPGASLTWANDINNAGHITGYFEKNGDPGFIATPLAAVPEPASVALAFFAAAPVGLIVRRRTR